MTTPRIVTETVPDSIRLRERADEAIAAVHDVQRDRVRASLLAVPDERGSSSAPHERPPVFLSA